MNEHEIETLLRKAPRVRVPAGLRERLEREAELPRRERITSHESQIMNYQSGSAFADSSATVKNWLTLSLLMTYG